MEAEILNGVNSDCYSADVTVAVKKYRCVLPTDRDLGPVLPWLLRGELCIT